MLRICSLFVLLASLWGAPALAATGPARVIDGDTLDIGGTRVRLHAIDAFEDGQSCRDPAGRPWDCAGWASALARETIAGRPVTCTPRDRDRYGRLVATCRVGQRDLGEALVEAGAALAYRRFGDDYVEAEKRAQAAGRGVWAGRFEPPWDWRAARRAAPVQTVGRCAIKGNLSSNGRIYHMPGQADYGRTVIRPERGERWFCSEAEARAAGWRRARR